MAIPPRLEKEIAELRQESVEVEVTEGPDLIELIIRNLPLGGGFNQPTSDLLLRIPRSYPDAGPDMFWTSPHVLLASGAVPQSAELLENHLGRQWRRFSWHKSAWNPRIDNVHGYLEFIRNRLRDKR